MDKHELNRDEYIKYLAYPKAMNIVFWTLAVIGILATFIGYPLSKNNLVVGVFVITVLLCAFFTMAVELVVAVVTSKRN